MLFSAFVLAVDCFVLRPSRFVTHATRRELCTLAGTCEQIRTKILSAFGGMMAGPCVGACGNFFWLRHDAQNCFKSSKNKQRIIHSKTKTKLSSGMPKRRKKHPASNVAAESAPHPRHAAIFLRPTPDGSRQVVYQAGKTIAFCKFTELRQWQSPTPCCESLRQQCPNNSNMMLWQRWATCRPLLLHTQATKEMSLLMSLWFLLTCHFLTQNRCGVAC